MQDSKAYICGAFEHPTRHAPDKSVVQLHAECAAGALADAGLTLDDVDGYFCAGDAPGATPLVMADHLNLRLRWLDGTDLGGCSYITLVAHAAAAIAAGRCSVALITMAGRPRSAGQSVGVKPRALPPDRPETPYDSASNWTIAPIYGMVAQRHMHQHGTTSAQLAAVKVAASTHAQHNPHALLKKRVTVEDVLASGVIADPLHKMDCCVITDGGGALVVTDKATALRTGRPLVKVLGSGETIQTNAGGMLDLTATGAAQSGSLAFAQAGLQPRDIQYASIYDNFTIMVILQLEDLGFCKRGQGGAFVAEGNLISGQGALPWNTDGGGLCNNHPQNRGGVTKVIEAVRQLRGEAHPMVQVPDCAFALASGPGFVLGAGHAHSSLILGRD
ncbi:thiolase domain-containing protein [Pseudorhodoferax sp.]|uniref:thiolase domain-containing protein n=1 Tax=Pseudorhodoferax sp. TaxID=1993553 RepID=UPI002DD6BA0A|nr:thiolase domain-containing protein [Pseudorhodoferax sp.]